jgi:threo-3-hydroxy-L-aspartate ammonia-lyase
VAVELDDVRAAAARLDGVAHRTPILTSRTLDERLGARLFLKAENLQRAGAFKFRGAYNAVSQLPPGTPVATASSGNHAQAVSLAARLLGTTATILMPKDAPPSKRAATEGYGAEVIEFDRYAEDREALLAKLAAERGLHAVHAYDDERVIAGQGTVGLELAQDVADLDTVVIPVGGGGLISGCATALPGGVRIVGVEPEASDDVARSMAAGERVRVQVGRTIADGQQLPTPGRLTWPIIKARVDDVVTVSDEEIVVALRFLLERMKVLVEPSGATALAALLAGKAHAGGRVGVVVSGGNVDPARLASLLG